jgi:predicted nucleic acid-binding protein
VKVLYDTSALFAALVPTHSQHAVCFTHLQMVQTREHQGYASTHSLAELYSVITRYPTQPRVTPAEADCLITDMLEYIQVVPLTLKHYQSAIAEMVALNLSGGGIFDALIAQSALEIEADMLLTLNPKHFNRLSNAIATIVQVPD